MKSFASPVLVIFAAAVLASCESSSQSEPQAAYPPGGNEYGSYPQYAGGDPVYPSDSDYVEVKPVQPQPSYDYGAAGATYQPPAYGAQPVYQPQPQLQPQPQAAPQPPAYTIAANNYTVVRGDTLYSISKRHGTTVTALKQANALSKDAIYPGDVLQIP